VSLEEVLGSPMSPWVREEGPAGDVVLSTRVRLARNLRGEAFPPRLGPEAAERVVGRVEEAVRSLGRRYAFHRLAQLGPLDRQVLVEKHLISPQHARQASGALALRDDEALSVMVLEEDHLRIQCLQAALQCEKAWTLADELDDALEKSLDYAFSPEWGYLVTSPTNLGTGMRASVMVHLPGLVLSNQAAQLFAALSKVGVVVRGLYGEGTAAAGNIFQVSNQTSLGQSEEDIVKNLEAVARQVVDRERSARERVHREMRDRVEDRVARAYGILTNARLISSAEALALMSDLRLGIDLGVIGHLDRKVFDELIVMTRPGFLQKLSGGAARPAERDVRRAALIRQRIRSHERNRERDRSGGEA
jgi:protein arginine kinase